MNIKINHMPLLPNETLKDRLEKEIETTQAYVDKQNRKVRRSKQLKYVATMLGVLGTIGFASVAKAESLDPTLEDAPVDRHTGIGGWIFDKLLGNMLPDVPDQLNRSDSLMWKLNEYMSNTLMHTHNFFSNPQILNLFHTVSAITMSFTTIIIAKKGYDMIKAKVLGASTMGVTDLIVRLFASLVLSFLSLKVGSWGIDLSNALVKTFIGSTMKGFVPTALVENSMVGAAFWIAGFIIMFTILGLQYWIRQINMVVMGVMSPVATMAWVTDGGAMLGTLIKEFVKSLVTPVLQSATMVITTVMMTEIASGMNLFSQVFLALSSLCVMVMTPTFLNLFMYRSANPIAWAAKTAIQAKALPLKVKGLFK